MEMPLPMEYHIPKKIEKEHLPSANWILEEQGNSLDVQDLISGNLNGTKKIESDENQYFEIKAHRNYWMNIHLIADEETDSLGLVFTPKGNGWPWEFTFKNVEAHIFKNNKKLRLAYSGSGSPFHERDYPHKIDPSIIWIKAQAKDSLNLWVKLTMAEKISGKIKLELADYRIIKQQRPANFYFSAHHALNGIGIALLFIALALYLWFRDPIYWWFMLVQFSLFSSFYFGEFNNETYLLIFREHPRSFVIITTLIYALRTVFILQFGRVYIGTKIKFPKIDFCLFIGISILSLITIFGVLSRIYPGNLGDFWFSFRQNALGLNFLFVISILLYLIFSKDKLARVFSSGIMITFITVLIQLIIVNRYGDPDKSHTTLLNHGFIILTTTAILAYRFVNITQEKRRAEKERMKSDLEKIKQEQLAKQKSKEAARLEELDKIKNNFFSNITHEFRTPLTLIIEPLNQVLNQPEKPWRNKVQLAKNNSQKLLQLINQLLDVSKLEDNKMSLELKRGNILDVVQPLFESFAILAKEKKIELTYQNKIKTHFFDFDQDKIEKIITNLASNAIKFTGQDGHINIEIKEALENGKSNFILTVKDNGIGIPEKDQAHIFDRFYQADGSNTRKYQGTGIGLSLCKELVELMDGTLGFESELGKGSRFEAKIPMRFGLKEEKTSLPTENNPIVLSQNISSSTSELDLEKSNIALVIEDNDELRAFIKSSIENHYQVIEASNGREGLEKAMEFIPNIIISDVMMPEMNGFEVCEKTKTDEKTAHIPVILLTAKTAMDSRIQGLEFGADAYMNKPFNTKELLIWMKNLIEVRELLQKKYSQQIEGTIGSDNSPKLGISSFDEQFLQKIRDFVLERLGEEEFSIEDIAKEMTMSRTQLFRKTKALLNQSPSEFLRNIRLKEARQLLLDKKGNISEIAYQVGFSSQKYFSTKFKEKYGISPGEI